MKWLLCGGDSDIEEGSKYWTIDVILKSHPAGKDELKVGMVVLAKFDSCDGFSDEELANSIWSKYLVLDVSDLFKGVVQLGLFVDPNGPQPERVESVPLRNIRISDSPDLGIQRP